MKSVKVKTKKKIDQDVLVVYWNSEGQIFSGYAEIFDDGSALIELKLSQGKVIKQAGSWLRFLDYKILSATVVKRAVDYARKNYGK